MIPIQEFQDHFLTCLLLEAGIERTITSKERGIIFCSLGFVILFIGWDKGAHYVAQASLKLKSLLPQLPPKTAL